MRRVLLPGGGGSLWVWAMSAAEGVIPLEVVLQLGAGPESCLFHPWMYSTGPYWFRLIRTLQLAGNLFYPIWFFSQTYLQFISFGCCKVGAPGLLGFDPLWSLRHSLFGFIRLLHVYISAHPIYLSCIWTWHSSMIASCYVKPSEVDQAIETC